MRDREAGLKIKVSNYVRRITGKRPSQYATAVDAFFKEQKIAPDADAQTLALAIVNDYRL